MVITFYWHPGSPPAKVVWSILEALEIPYEKKYIDLLGKKDQNTPEYLAINPEGKVPYIVDGNFGLGESRAIICYLCSKYEKKDKEKKLYPTELNAQAKVNASLFQDFQFFANIMEYFNVIGILYRGESGPNLERWDAVLDTFNRIERRLSNQDYMAADYITIADHSAFVVVAGIEHLLPGLEIENYPHLMKWKKEMEELPSYSVCYGDSIAKCKVIFDQIASGNKEKKLDDN